MKLLLALAVMLAVTAATHAADGFTADRTASGGVDVKIDGKPFAVYVVDQSNKPYIWPIYGPTGKAMTRAYPMAKVEGEQTDHFHHRGITFGHEHINDGIDTWVEAGSVKNNPKKLAEIGTIKHREFKTVEAEKERATIVDLLDYLDHDGKRVLSEERRITFRASGDVRTIDFDQDLIAGDVAAKFGDGKDAGLSIRVPTSMAVDTKKGGRIVSSTGLVNADAWGKPAAWVDYNGPVEGEQLGIAILDHPSSFRHPTNWHVRTYGLFGANPFGAKVFDKNAADATYELKAGERLKLRHRFVFHKGDEKAANIAAMYEAYSKESK